VRVARAAPGSTIAASVSRKVVADLGGLAVLGLAMIGVAQLYWALEASSDEPGLDTHARRVFRVASGVRRS
jgi:hypothetical protein